jgi:N-acetylneuraminic acid mutarotase
MVVWSGKDSSSSSACAADGGVYDPLLDSWTLLPNSPIQGRVGNTTIWTGTEMIVWGGQNGSGYLNDGARYNPATGNWWAIPASAPARVRHTAVWTGKEMIIFGGSGISGFLGDAFSCVPGKMMNLYQSP